MEASMCASCPPIWGCGAGCLCEAVSRLDMLRPLSVDRKELEGLLEIGVGRGLFEKKVKRWSTVPVMSSVRYWTARYNWVDVDFTSVKTES